MNHEHMHKVTAARQSALQHETGSTSTPAVVPIAPPMEQAKSAHEQFAIAFREEAAKP